jgi:23S rRNA pseudouridine1911/1915/1917 synthase
MLRNSEFRAGSPGRSRRSDKPACREPRAGHRRLGAIRLRSSLLYVDEHLAIVNKGAGISLATRRGAQHAAAERLLESIKTAELLEWGLDPKDLYLVHRLDAGTTGLVVLARDPQTHRELTSAFQNREVDKTYLALVWGHPRPLTGHFDTPIGPDPGDRRRMKSLEHGRPAVTNYRVVCRGQHASLLELHPVTGRTHQLRVHLATAGHWIVGDDLYAGARHLGIRDRTRRDLLNPPHMLLHSWRLCLPETWTSGARIFEAPLPAHFRKVLDGLRLSLG